MTLYAGDTAYITLGADDWDDDVLTVDDVASVRVDVQDADAAFLVTAADMNWVSEHNLWLYKWDTTDVDPGSYRAKVLITGIDGSHSKEFIIVRLKKDRSLPGA